MLVVGLFDPEPHLGDKQFVFESEVSVNSVRCPWPYFVRAAADTII